MKIIILFLSDKGYLSYLSKKLDRDVLKRHSPQLLNFLNDFGWKNLTERQIQFLSYCIFEHNISLYMIADYLMDIKDEIEMSYWNIIKSLIKKKFPGILQYIGDK